MYVPRIFTRRDIESRIAAGDSLVIFQGHVLYLNKWQDVHPGGRLVIQHMVGRDASDEISILHSAETIESMTRHRIGRIAGEWENFVPPIQGGNYAGKTESSENTEITIAGDRSNSAGSSGSEMRFRSCGYHKDESTRELETTGGSLACSQAISGWKLEVSQDSYTAVAIKEALDADLARYPSVDAVTQRDITIRFRALHQRVQDEGYYTCHFSEYAREMLRYAILFGVFMLCLHRRWYVASAFSLGLFWQQIMFTAHDAGHSGITHNYVVDSLIGIFIGNLCCGLSIGWWKSSHNVHHIITNDPVHDPDTQNTPLFTTSPAFFSSVKSSYYNGFQFVWNSIADYTVKYQRWTYYPVMAVARFNLYYLSWLHLVSSRSIKRGTASWIRPTEVVAILCYIYLFFYLLLWQHIFTWQDRALFLFVSHLATLPLQIQITLSHWGASTSDLGPGEAFAQRQLRTTVDVACPEWLDFIHGGLQFQTVHHLFPRVPRHNLRNLQVLVKNFCEETGIDYQILGFVEGNRNVLGKLQQITDQAKILSACQKHMAATGNINLPKRSAR